MPNNTSQIYEKYSINRAIDSFPLKINNSDEFVLNSGKLNNEYVIFCYYFNKSLKKYLPKEWCGYIIIPMFQDVYFNALDTVL